MRKYLTCIVALFLAGCAAKLVPDDYVGPVAIVADSSANFVDGGFFKADKADFFYMNNADGKWVQSNFSITQGTFSGSGLNFKPVAHDRKVPAKPMQVKIIGNTYWAAPIGALLGKSYQVDGTVSFDPKPGQRYFVRGRLGEGYSAVWIENGSGTVVTKKVENRG